MATVHKCFIKMEKAFNLWMEDMNRKCVLIDGKMLCWKALACMNTLARNPLKWVTPSHLLHLQILK